MTIHETALKEIYSAFDRMNAAVGTDEAKDGIYGLFATIICQRMITGDPNERKPVGLLGRSPIQSVQDNIGVANRSIKNWRNP